MHVLITGGSGVIGQELVKGFLSKGVEVTFTSTSETSANKVLEKFESYKSKLHSAIVEFNDESDVKSFIKANVGKYTHLINNARSLKSVKVEEDGFSSATNIHKELFMSVTLPYLLSCGFIDTLKSIVNISSMYGLVTFNKHLYEDGYSSASIQYGIAKAAQIHLTKELAVRFADKGIRVNTVSFGGVEGRVNDDFKERYAKLCPAEKMLTKSELFDHVWYISSNSSKSLTGHNLIVDGGWTIW
ncbi:SDR family oxidoreductase [Francisella sp. 19X1-34]|uniref:SDR family oxidoreductase n=1 Tax=Francisella sp. 19X1-34 TaxID=3087177 RepID=UPI002E2FBD26|nr:SDR family oxidoreductase [Francisella sp. 19X1-34]MED7787535.1 SDR family oxidoreductase [Francisella sp. 19X1-34]